jgi:hypothetical protein
MDMATDKQIEANRRNAQLSTGPRSLVGKQKSSLNALRHGLTSQSMTIPGEDPEELRQLRCAMMGTLNPQGALENQLVERIAVLTFRLKRVPVYEAALLAWTAYLLAATHDAPYEMTDAGDIGLRNDPFPDENDSIHDLQDRLRLGRVMEHLLDTDAVAKLASHESLLQRQVSAAINDLLKLQRLRQEAQKQVEKDEASAKAASRGSASSYSDKDIAYFDRLERRRLKRMGPP